MNIKPGYKTTEFWVTVITAGYGFLNAAGVVDAVSNWRGGIIMTAAAAAYKISRGLAKRPTP